MTKYTADYARDYACLWAYGQEALGLPGAALLYSRVNTITLNSLNEIQSESDALIVDIGCGVERNIRDLARARPEANFIGVDESPAMLEITEAVLCGEQEVLFSPTHREFPKCRLQGHALKNVGLMRSKKYCSYITMPNRQANLCISVNAIERSDDVDDYISLLSDSLCTNGHLIIASSLNWTREEYWRRFPNFSMLLRHFCKACNFRELAAPKEVGYFEQVDIRSSGKSYIVSIEILEKAGSAP